MEAKIIIIGLNSFFQSILSVNLILHIFLALKKFKTFDPTEAKTVIAAYAR